MEKQPPNFIDNLKGNFPVIVFFVGMAVTWGVFQTRIANLEIRMTAMELKQSANEQTVNNLQVNVASQYSEIKTSLEFIKQRLQ